MLKSKLLFGLIAVVMVLAFAQSGFAQVTITATPGGSPRETETNRTAETNDPNGGSVIIVGTSLSDAPVQMGALRIDYQGQMTSSTALPSSDAIRIEAATGIFTGATILTAYLNFEEGRVEIDLPNCSPCVTSSTGTIILSGVRVDANGLTAPVTATLSLQSGAVTTAPNPAFTGTIPNRGSNVNVVLSTTEMTVISALSKGIRDIRLGKSSTDAGDGTATIFTNRTVPDQKASFFLTEGHVTAWFNNSSTQFGAAGPFLNDTQLKIEFLGVPDGVELAIDNNASAATTLSRAVITKDDNTTTVNFESTQSVSATNRVTINIASITVASTASLSEGTISVRATMAPIGDALDDTKVPVTTAFPRFAEAATNTLPIVSLVPANTTLLIPLAVRDGAFDTGIALSNTTADPYAGAGGATAQNGRIRLDFFPRAASGAGTAFSLTTSSTVRPGIGLSADGKLASGGTWTALLSELLQAAGQTGSFTGYIFIRADFLNAHGAPFVSDFKNFTSFTPMLVLAPPAIRGRTASADNPIESLGF